MVKVMAKKQVDPAVSAYLASIGRKGGKANVRKGIATLTPEERSARARAAAAARWGNQPRKAKRK
jgi:hypothetical protein